MPCARPSSICAAALGAGPTAISCCGANPGMVSWFVKQALLNVATDCGIESGDALLARGLGAARAEDRHQGHPHRRTRHAAREDAEADGRLRQHLVGRGLYLGRPAAGRARLGHARETYAAGRQAARVRAGLRDLSDAARRRHAGAVLDADRQGAARLAHHP